MEQRLSDFLLEQVDLYGTDGASLPSNRDLAARIYLERIAKRLIEFRESFTDGKFFLLDLGSELDHLDLEKGLQNDPELFEIEIDRVLSCQALEDIPATVKRLILLSRLNAVLIPSDQTAIYIREAARTYLHGLFQASAAMSRAAIEQATKDVLGRQGVGDFIRFQNLLDQAKKRKVLDDVTEPAVRNTVEKANRVMHEWPTDQEGAWKVLIEVRGFLQEIYSTKGGL